VGDCRIAVRLLSAKVHVVRRRISDEPGEPILAAPPVGPMRLILGRWKQSKQAMDWTEVLHKIAQTDST